MSAICGIFNIDGSTVLTEMSSRMMDKLKVYPLDDTGIWLNQEVFLGCGIQYCTPESLKEKLPLYDENRRISITADAIIDNREELFAVFNISQKLWDNTTDSDLILMAYDKWGEECPKYLVGDFAFVIWNEKKKELFCARDHVGKRTLYYYYSKDVFAFCTVMKPLFIINDDKINLNERWITDFLSLNGILHETEFEETVYKDIYQVPPAHSITINREGFSKKLYWNPLIEVQPLYLKTDEEYDEAFRKVFFEAVHCRLRSTNDVGVMLSGGLDSGSVACVAAKKLSKQNKRLKAFSSVPIGEYKNKSTKHYIFDESEYIEAISNYSGNIDVNYFRCEGKDSLINIDHFIYMLEQPYKVMQNTFWINEIMESASQSGCKVILNGHFGNSTISAGSFDVHARTLFRKGKLLTLLKEVKQFSSEMDESANRIGKVLIKTFLPFKLRKTVYRKLYKNHDKFSSVIVNPNLILKWSVESRFDKDNYNQIISKYYNFYESKKYLVNNLAFSHIGAIDTKMSLVNGISLRDPTRDKRVIEFCLSLDYDQFVRNGQERHLIRRAMEGILPDKVRLNTSRMGLQGPDWIERLEPKWKDIRRELEKMMEDKDIQTYIDCDKLKDKLVVMENTFNDKSSSTILMCLIALVFSRFIKNYKESAL
jgi:asparagine synthase (glutamine-hydrolysing)